MPRRMTIPQKRDSTRKGKKIPIDEILTDVTICLSRVKCMKNLSTDECADDLFQIKDNLVNLRDVDSKRLVASLLHDKDFISIFKRLYASTTSSDIFDPANGQALSNLKEGIGILWLGCKLDPRLCQNAGAPVLKMLLEFIATKGPKAEGRKSPAAEDQLDLTLGVFGIIHNLLSQNANEEIRELVSNMPSEVKCLAAYLEEDVTSKLSQTATLILSLTPSELIGVEMNWKHAVVLLDQLKLALQDSKFHYCKETGFGSADILLGLNRLLTRKSFSSCAEPAVANFDPQNSAWPEMFSQILRERPPDRETELEFCCQLLCLFTLSETLRTTLFKHREGQITTQLREILHGDANVGVNSTKSQPPQQPEQKPLEDGAHERPLADNVLLLHHFFSSETPRQTSASHVFLAAVEANPNPLVKKIRERLKMFGFEVYCSPLGTITGSALKDAVECVENAAAVVLCLTKDLVDDPSCRIIVAMTRKLNVVLIPVLLEENSLTGWIEDEITLRSDGKSDIITVTDASTIDEAIPAIADVLGNLGKKPRQSPKARKGVEGQHGSKRRNCREMEKRSRSVEKLLESASTPTSPTAMSTSTEPMGRVPRTVHSLDRDGTHITITGSGAYPFGQSRFHTTSFPLPKLGLHNNLHNGELNASYRGSTMTLAEVAQSLNVPQSPTSPHYQFSPCPLITAPALFWGFEEVCFWLKSLRLDETPLAKQELSGELLLELKAMLMTVPGQYYLTVKEMGISGTEVLRLTSGLRKLNDSV